MSRREAASGSCPPGPVFREVNWREAAERAVPQCSAVQCRKVVQASARSHSLKDLEKKGK